MDCWEFCEAFRDVPYEIQERTSIFLFSSAVVDYNLAMEHDLTIFTGCLPKPLTRESLKAHVLDKIVHVPIAR
jgi:hypothetical protein